MRGWRAGPQAPCWPGSAPQRSQPRNAAPPILAFAPIAVCHFGSSAGAAGPPRSDSDLDLAFIAAGACDPYQVFPAAQAIARLARREVDLVDLMRAGDVPKAQAIGTGRRVFTGPGAESAADEFEMYTLSSCARLNEERRELFQPRGWQPMNRDIFLNKRQSLRSCLARVREKFAGGPASPGGPRSPGNHPAQPAAGLQNRHRSRDARRGLRRPRHPQDTRDAFRLLARAGWIDRPLGERMQSMVGFRNIALHQYHELSLEVLAAILDHHLGDFEDFCAALGARA